MPITTILAYSDGLRLTWDLPTKVSDFRIGRAIQRRDLLEMVDLVLSGYSRRQIIFLYPFWCLFFLFHRHGMDGGACVLKALCEAASLPFPASGLINKILHRIFASVYSAVEINNSCKYSEFLACVLQSSWPRSSALGPLFRAAKRQLRFALRLALPCFPLRPPHAPKPQWFLIVAQLFVLFTD